MAPALVPLQVPGGVELLVVLLIISIPLAFAVTVAVGVVLLKRYASATTAARIDELESRVQRIENRVLTEDN